MCEKMAKFFGRRNLITKSKTVPKNKKKVGHLESIRGSRASRVGLVQRLIVRPNSEITDTNHHNIIFINH